MRSHVPPEIDVPAVIRAAELRVASTFPGGAAMASDVLERLTPPAWALEWYLPTWLGEAFDLDRGLVGDLVISNVLGLLSVRLEDDIADGDVLAADVALARQLAAVAYTEALVVYRTHLTTNLHFWAFVERSMTAWRRERNGPSLSSRGAPIKIAAFACSLLANRPVTWLALDCSLDHLLAAYVRYDQFCDWESDVAAGRWNAFVASVTHDEQRSADPTRTSAAVRAAMLTTSVVVRWFEMIDGSAALAIAAAWEDDLAPLRAHLEDWAARTRAQGAETNAHYRRTADLATEIMFGPALRASLLEAPTISTR